MRATQCVSRPQHIMLEYRVVLFALLLSMLVPAAEGVLKIKECSSGSVTQDENHTPAYLTCDGFTDTDNVTWSVGNKNASRATEITCTPRDTTCASADREVSVTRTGNHSYLRVRGNYRARSGEDSIMCSADNQTAVCSVNVIAAARLSNCDVTLNASDWTVTGRCLFEGAYSSTGLYTCTWHQHTDTQTDSSIVGVVAKRATLTAHSVYYSGVCRFMTSLSPWRGEGRYFYSVTFFPGPEYKPAGNVAIWSPGEPIMNCPQYVYEGQSLSCDCLVNPASPGFPPATAQWQGSSPGQQLVINDVTRDDAGRVFTCSLTWGPANDTIVKTSDYELIVAYPPPSPPVITGHGNKSVLLVGNRLTLTCTVTGGRPLVTSLSVGCGTGVQSEPSAMTVVNNSVTLTFSIEAVEARHDGTECVCTGKWEGGREAYNASGRIVLTVIQDVNKLAWQVIAGASGGSLALVVCIVVVVVAASKGQRRENDDNTSAELGDESPYDVLRRSRIGLRSIYSVIHFGRRHASQVDSEDGDMYDKLRQSDIGCQSVYSLVRYGGYSPQQGQDALYENTTI